MIYETKNLTLEQVDELYSECKSARKSVRWTPTQTFRQIRSSMAAQGGLDGTGEKKLVSEDEKAVGADYVEHR